MSDSKTTASFNIELGRLYWSSIRNLIKQAQVRGHDVRLIEGPGWIDREFRVEGELSVVQSLRATMVEFVREMGASS